MFAAVAKPRRTTPRLEEVSLAQFAAICGLTEREFLDGMFWLLAHGKLLEGIKDEARSDFSEWINQKKLSTGTPFCVMFRLSLNRVRDAALYCVCSFKGDKVRIQNSIPGLSGIVPKEASKLNGFEFNFCDLRTEVMTATLGETVHASESI